MNYSINILPHEILICDSKGNVTLKIISDTLDCLVGCHGSKEPITKLINKK